ncbi:cation-translocating P-type ATPase [Patescibacteria group bacterium]|nr:cation-translocating P-type ATPase [Patescibacteria group bacterium]
MFHTVSSSVMVERLAANQERGLSGAEAKQRLEQYGFNALPQAKKKHWLWVLAGHFKDVLMGILVVSAIISFFVGDVQDGAIILLIVIANGLMGFFQERKADNAIEALKKLSVAHAKVIRDGIPLMIEASQVVPGDLLVLETGDKVPADARLIESVQLKISESMLTGESRPVEKDASFVAEEGASLGDRLNMLYRDTAVLYGRGRAIVTATGSLTEIGKISKLLQTQESKDTALHIELSRLGKRLTIFAGVAAALMFVTILLADMTQLRAAFLTAISLAIAVVPEGIPAVVTTVLAISVARLARKRAVIRKLAAIEILGSATCILTDKTGTLTKNEMTVSDVSLLGRAIQWSDGRFVEAGQPLDLEQDAALRQLIYCSVLCNDAMRSEQGKMIGDPTEASLIVMAEQAGIDVARIRAEHERVFEIPFSSETKHMTVVVKNQTGKVFAFTKGASETVCSFLGRCEAKHKTASEQLSAQGIRSLVYSMKELNGEPLTFQNPGFLLKDQEYLGTIGCKDPLRPEVKGAIALAASAGIKTVMITGDHKLIAKTIGSELGLVTRDDQVLNATELDRLSAEELAQRLPQISVFSRVSPEQKLQIVKAAMQSGETVAVTGDGVNDAPAIKTADIGIAMGISGTDVAREAADMVLQDDNYSTIVEAIRQGRGIFVNFTKFLMYQISCNASGVLIVFPLTLLTGVSPLFPVHILLLNLVSETGPCIALGLEKPEQRIMEQKPRARAEGLLNRARWIKILVESLLLGGVGIAAYFLTSGLDPLVTTSAVLATAFLSRLWHALSARSEHVSLFSSSLQANRALTYTVIGTLFFLGAALYTNVGNALTKTVPLSPIILFYCLLLSLIPVVGVEIYKALGRQKMLKSGM